MRVTLRSRSVRRRGLTLIEVTIASAILGILTFALISASSMGQASYRTVSDSAEAGGAMRTASNTIAAELQVANEDVVAVVALPDGNHQVTFAQPIVIGGAITWGVHDATWGPAELDQNREGWQLRYTVRQGGDGVRRLMRQVLDPTDVIQEEDELCVGLRRGDVDPPGFAVTQLGDVWQVQLTREGHTEGSRGHEVQLHVRIRN